MKKTVNANPALNSKNCQMKYNVTFYCPDRHILYDGGRLPDKKGVGGGVTVRIRMAHALASLGHSVTMICNCSRKEVDRNVLYIPLDAASVIESDILILTTSGGDLSLLPFLDLTVTTKLTILMAHGVDQPKGLHQISIDRYYAISNFIRTVMHNDWGIPSNKIFVSHHGVSRDYFQPVRTGAIANKRDPFRLAYLGHPQKGRDAAFGILKILRNRDSRYHLYLFGDERLWGERARMIWGVKGIKNFGLINQKKLARELLGCSFGIFLQSRREPFGLTIIEAMTAGCIPIASPVGAYREIIQDDKNGFLVEGDPNNPNTWESVANLISELQTKPSYIENLRSNAQNWPLDWLDVVKTWEQHWDIVLETVPPEKFTSPHACKECESPLIEFSDGLHCSSCGTYFKNVKELS